jgi:hypothetical protein
MSPGSNDRLDRTIASVGGFVFLAGIMIIGWQGYYWLTYGHWYPISLRIALIQLGIPLPRFTWFTAQKVFDVCAELPFSLYVFVLAAGIMAYAAYLTEKELKRRRERNAPPSRDRSRR